MKKRILVIDDNRAIRQSVAYILEQNGFGVSEAKDGLEGVLKFKEAVGQGDKDFDLVITDINMPNLDGIGVIKQIREFGSFVPILVLTTESEQSKVIIRMLKFSSINIYEIKFCLKEQSLYSNTW